MPTPLTEVEKDMLRFSRLSWRYAGLRETAIREQFDMSREGFGLKLARLIRREEAMAFDPIVTKRLRRIAGITPPA